MARHIRDRRLNEKLADVDAEIVRIVGDIRRNDYHLRDHEEFQLGARSSNAFKWHSFLVVHEGTVLAIWVVKQNEMSNLALLRTKPLGMVYKKAIDTCLKGAIIHQYRLVQQNGVYCLDYDTLCPKDIDFDMCCYVGPVMLTERAISVFFASIADKNHLLDQDDYLQYYRECVVLYFDLLPDQEDEMTTEQHDALEGVLKTARDWKRLKSNMQNAEHNNNNNNGDNNNNNNQGHNNFPIGPVVALGSAVVVIIGSGLLAAALIVRKLRWPRSTIHEHK